MPCLLPRKHPRCASPGNWFWGTQEGQRWEAQKSGCSPPPALLANSPGLLRENDRKTPWSCAAFVAFIYTGPRVTSRNGCRDTNSKLWNWFLNNASLHRSSQTVGGWPFQKDRFLYLLIYYVWATFSEAVISKLRPSETGREAVRWVLVQQTPSLRDSNSARGWG